MPTQNQKPPTIFDRARIAERMQKRMKETPDPSAPDFVTQLIIDDLHQRLAPISREFKKPLVIGPVAQFLPENSQTASGPVTFTRASSLHPWDGLRLDPENFHPPEDDYDLIVSLLDLQMVNNVPGFLRQIRHHLAPDGLMLAAAIGGNSFAELRQAWLNADAAHSGGAYARIAPFIDVRDAGALMQHAGFALPVADIEHHQVRYGSPLALMQEIRTLAASNPLIDRPSTPVTKMLLASASASYEQQAADDDGRVRAQLDILWLSGWAPHESQQKPLAPGSAQVSLKQVLKSKD